MDRYNVEFFGTEGYEKAESNYGDCVLIYNENRAIVYDCGSEEHANALIKRLNSKKIQEIDVIISHNDSDHTKGILTLIKSEYVRYVYTTLLLKYKKEIMKIIDDKRRTSKATGEHILELYDNIADIPSEYLVDIYEQLDTEKILRPLPSGIKLIGPTEDTLFNAVSKAIEENDIQTKEGIETVVNAASIQISVDLKDEKKILLLGDSSPENIPDDLSGYDYIQLPHHGKEKSAEAIFNKIPSVKYSKYIFIISDNTGNSNGGSNKLMKSPVRVGKLIKNTNQGSVIIGKKQIYADIVDASRSYGCAVVRK